MQADTIFALSSGRPPAAIAVVRMSGPAAGEALRLLTGGVPTPRAAKLVRVRDPDSGDTLDQAVALWFPGPASETGEDLAELQLHGGRAVIAAVLATLGRLPGLRLAEPGEFTRRGFENGKLDLTAVEGLADLIGAETEAQRRQALRQLRGALGAKAEDWRGRLIAAQAQIEAAIDFSDEDDVPDGLLAAAREAVRPLAAEIQAALQDGGRGERLREGLVVAIAGPPNAGKSTLLNRLAQREVAIVSPYAGTTRDVIEVHLDLGGFPVTLLDTAGQRESSDPVEQEGIRRAQARAAEADLILWVTEENGSEGANDGSARPQAESAIDPEHASPRPTPGTPVWRVRNKCDLDLKKTGSSSDLTESNSRISEFGFSFCLSAATGQGVDALIGRLKAFAETALAVETGMITRARHRKALQEVAEHLRLFAAAQAEELAAEELRLAARALARLTGRIDVEDVLDVIFRDFCIGK